ncbi:MAG: hypothetical protein ABL929_06170 [Ferruginibacter sp.]|nr:hypothetical protein [Ferruginibacter sp.]
MNHTLITHNILRWAVLLFGLWSLANAITGVVKKRNFTNADNKINLFFMIACDIQLLLGLILYFNGTWFSNLTQNGATVMKDAVQRYFSVEHAMMMFIAWVLVHVGKTMVKKSNTDVQKHKRSLIYFGLAILIILAMIPWPYKQIGIARNLLPQF